MNTLISTELDGPVTLDDLPRGLVMLGAIAVAALAIALFLIVLLRPATAPSMQGGDYTCWTSAAGATESPGDPAIAEPILCPAMIT